MNSYYLKKVMEASEKAAQRYKDEYTEKLTQTQKYVNLYTDYVLQLIESYDFGKNAFDLSRVDEITTTVFGSPEKIKTDINEEGVGKSNAVYKVDEVNNPIGMPEYLSDTIDFNEVNEVLNDYGIQLNLEYRDDEYLTGYDYNVYFDASVIDHTKRKLDNELQDIKQRILK